MNWYMSHGHVTHGALYVLYCVLCKVLCTGNYVLYVPGTRYFFVFVYMYNVR